MRYFVTVAGARLFFSTYINCPIFSLRGIKSRSSSSRVWNALRSTPLFILCTHPDLYLVLTWATYENKKIPIDR
jgi:hypothetical protein